MGDRRAPMPLECWHGGERRAWWCRKGRDGLGRRRRSCRPARIVARFADRDPGRGIYRVLVWETGGRSGKTVGGALRIDRRGRRRAGVRAWVHARGAPGGAPDRGGRDRRYSLGDPRYAGLRRPGLDLLPGQPHSLRHPRSRYPGLGLISRRSLDEEGVKRIAYYPLAASAACSPKTKSSSSGRVTPARSRRRSFWYFLIAAFRVPRPRVAHLGREATTWRPS